MKMNKKGEFDSGKFLKDFVAGSIIILIGGAMLMFFLFIFIILMAAGLQ